MKTIYTILLFTLLSPSIFAQEKYFEFTPTGFVSSSDNSQDFIVLDFEGKNKQDLYKASLMYFSKMFVSPNDVLSRIENESISVNGVIKNAVKLKHLYLNPSWDINFTINFDFKDNKAKVVAVSVNKISTYTGNIYRTKELSDFFNKKGEVRKQEDVDKISSFINSFIYDYKKELDSNKADDW